MKYILIILWWSVNPTTEYSRAPIMSSMGPFAQEECRIAMTYAHSEFSPKFGKFIATCLPIPN